MDNPHQPISGEGASPASSLRRRRARSLLPFIGQDERDQALDDLAGRAFPRLDFFLYTLLAAFLIGLSFVFTSPVLLVAGLAFSPLLSPLTGTALGLVTGSFRFAVRNLAALVVAWILAFFAAWAGSFLFSFLPSRGAYPAMPDVFTAVVVVLAAAALTWRFVRGAADAWIPSLIVAYGSLYPICAAAGLTAAGAGGAANAWLAWAIYTSLALLVSIGTYLAFGFRPPERDLGAYAGLAAAGAVCLALLLVWSGATPSAAPPPMGTLEPILLPTASCTPTLSPTITLTATISPPPSETPKPSATLTPTGTPVPAVVRGTGGQGVFLRDAPGLNGKKIASLQEGEAVEVLGPSVEADGTLWIPVRTASGIEGWMALEYCATATPAATRA
ncbi:MAG: SH3 domain-containing protein [Anaerolineales bacterium]|nr:SH3 domain-containing protein [Anaerolineales bacterium]